MSSSIEATVTAGSDVGAGLAGALRPGHVLVASHGTAGARAAERAAVELCRPGGLLRHLHVVPDFWRGMMGDDWLNNVATRITYGNYLRAIG